MFRKANNQANLETYLKEKSCCSKIFGGIMLVWHLLFKPFDFIRNFTVPMCEQSEWNKYRAVAAPLTVPFSMLFLF
jgi:hypothetical protein